MNELIFPAPLQSASALNLLCALIESICDEEEGVVYKEHAVSPMLFVIHGGWLQTKPCQDGMIYRAISAKKLAHYFYSTWLPLHQACIEQNIQAYLAARARLLHTALQDIWGQRAAFWGDLARIAWAAQLFPSSSNEREKDALLLSFAYQFGIQIFWVCHTTLALKGQVCSKCDGRSLTSTSAFQMATLLLNAENEQSLHAWVEAMLLAERGFHELPPDFRRHILTQTAHDFLTVMQQKDEWEGCHA